MTNGLYFDFGDVRITVPDHYIDKLLDLAWFWAHTRLAEKIETSASDVIDIDREEFIQLTELLYALVR